MIFTGDPIMPRFFTEGGDRAELPPRMDHGRNRARRHERVRAARSTRSQWAHAFGLQLTPARVIQAKNQAYTVHQWYFGTKPPSDKSYAITFGDVKLLFDGLQSAGPKLTPDELQGRHVRDRAA